LTPTQWCQGATRVTSPEVRRCREVGIRWLAPLDCGVQVVTPLSTAVRDRHHLSTSSPAGMPGRHVNVLSVIHSLGCFAVSFQRYNTGLSLPVRKLPPSPGTHVEQIDPSFGRATNESYLVITNMHSFICFPLDCLQRLLSQSENSFSFYHSQLQHGNE